MAAQARAGVKYLTVVDALACADIWCEQQTGLLDLPNELLGQILVPVLVRDVPIELAPIRPLYDTRITEVLGPCQYQHALTYQNAIRPTLGVLRVCKTLHELGRNVYYSANTFSFASDLGWLVLARFFYLIGPSNISLLRNLTIIHPRLSAASELDDEERVTCSI